MDTFIVSAFIKIQGLKNFDYLANKNFQFIKKIEKTTTELN